MKKKNKEELVKDTSEESEESPKEESKKESEDSSEDESEDLEKEESKEQKSKEDKEEEKKDSQESGAKWLVIGIVAVVIGLFVFGWVLSESKKFDYIGLTFTKENFGEIPIYKVPLAGNTINGQPINFNLALRNNPMESKVPVIGTLEYDVDRDIWLTIDLDSGIHECGSESLVAFGQFMDAIGYKINTGVTTKESAKELERPHVTCDNTNGATVFTLTTGDKSQIVREGSDKDCYTLEVNNCELTEVMERLEIATLAYIRGESL
jgi:hypothetical protein